MSTAALDPSDQATPATGTRRPPLDRFLDRLGACREAIEWAGAYGADYGRAWAECPRGDWLLWLCARLGVDRKMVVSAACDCAELSLPHVRPGDDRPRVAIETARRWVRREATIREVRAARDDAAAARARAYAAAAAYAYAYAAARTAARLKCAELVRGRIPWVVVEPLLSARVVAH